MDVVSGFVPALVVAKALLLVAPSINRDAASLVSKSGHQSTELLSLFLLF